MCHPKDHVPGNEGVVPGENLLPRKEGQRDVESGLGEGEGNENTADAGSSETDQQQQTFATEIPPVKKQVRFAAT